MGSDEEFLDGLPIVTEAFARTVRLVTTARLRDAVLKPLVDTPEELGELAEIEGATSARLVAQERGTDGIGAREMVYDVPHAHFINASFAYAKPREFNRFNDQNRGAWYAALDVDTCLAEVIYHMTDFLSRSGVFEAEVDYSEMFASLAGKYVDLRGLADHPSLSADTAVGYRYGNAIAGAVRQVGLNGVIYPSVRHAGGTCIAALRPAAVQSVTQGAIYRLTWAGNPTPAVKRM